MIYKKKELEICGKSHASFHFFCYLSFSAHSNMIIVMKPPASLLPSHISLRATFEADEQLSI